VDEIQSIMTNLQHTYMIIASISLSRWERERDVEGTEHAKGVAFLTCSDSSSSPANQWPVGDDAGTLKHSGPVWSTLVYRPFIIIRVAISHYPLGITLLLLLLLVYLPPHTLPLHSYYNAPSGTPPEHFLSRPHPAP